MNQMVSRGDEIETAQILMEGLRDGVLFATRDPDGALRFHHIDNGGREDALPLNEVLAELSRDLN
jgi:hypothetical protein